MAKQKELPGTVPAQELEERQALVSRLKNAITAKETELDRHARAMSDAAKLKRLAEKELSALRQQLIAIATRDQ